MKKRHLLMLKRWCVSNPKSRGKRIFLAQDIGFIWFLSDCVMNRIESNESNPNCENFQKNILTHYKEVSFSKQRERRHSLIRLIARPCLEYLKKNANWRIRAYSPQHVYNWATSGFANIKGPNCTKQIKTTIASTVNIESRAVRSSYSPEHRATDWWRHDFRWGRKTIKYYRWF